MNITCIGAGNVVWHLAPILEQHGCQIIEVYSRQESHAQRIASMLKAALVQTHLNFSESTSDLFLLAIPDDAIERVVAQLVLPPKAVVVHTSGSCSLEQLSGWLQQYHQQRHPAGVFYALQTFTMGQPIAAFDQTPICIEAADTTTESLLVEIAHRISRNVYIVSSDKRLALHLSAVWAGNFTNHMLARANQITTLFDVDFEVLKPLILETIRKALAADNPAHVQTGPARRHDQTTLRKHEKLLQEKPVLADLYRVISNSIAQLDDDLRR